MTIKSVGIGACFLVLSACAELPDLRRAVPPSELSGPYPALVPVETLISRTRSPRIEEGDQTALSNRGASLRARARSGGSVNQAELDARAARLRAEAERLRNL